MTYEDFKEMVTTSIQTTLGSTFKLKIEKVSKNNGITLDGLTIITDGINISPTIYLNSYYIDFLKGRPLNNICLDIIDLYNKHMPKENFDTSNFVNWDIVQENIICKLVNYEQNKELLKDVPHVSYLDLAIIFCVFLECNSSNLATILIHNHHLSLWDKKTDDLFKIALNNTPRLLEYQLNTLTQLLDMELQDNTDSNTFFPGMIPMYVLTNKFNINGATCILYPDLLDNLATKLRSDLYILPSSIHETIIIPMSAGVSQAELCEMVKSVNSTDVAHNEILSDNVYYYCKETKQVSM